VVIFACQGNTPSIPSAALDRLVSYANQGGRVWAAHYGYTWLNQTALSPVVTWNPDYYASMNSTAVVDQSFPGGQILAQWLQNRGASTTLGNLTLANSRSDVATVIAPAQNWLNIHPYAADLPMLLTFNTPVDAVGSPATSKVGRILYTDFHFEPVSTVFPLECGSLSVISTNERVMEFMFLNLLNPLSIP